MQGHEFQKMFLFKKNLNHFKVVAYDIKYHCGLSFYLLKQRFLKIKRKQ
jgi:hypothetical protein